MARSRFVYYSSAGHFGFICVFAVMNTAAMTLAFDFLCGYIFSFLYGIDLEVALRDLPSGTAKIFSKALVPFYVPTCSV